MLCFCLICDACSLRCYWNSRILFHRVGLCRYSWCGSTTALEVALSVSICLSHVVVFSVFMICSDFCAFIVLYVSFGSSDTPNMFDVCSWIELCCLFVDVVWCYIL